MKFRSILMRLDARVALACKLAAPGLFLSSFIIHLSKFLFGILLGGALPAHSVLTADLYLLSCPYASGLALRNL